MPLILTKKWNAQKHSYTTTINAGYSRSSLGRDSDTYIAGLAVGASLDSKTRLIGAMAAEKERGSGDVTKTYRVGVVRLIGKIGNNYEVEAFGTAGKRVLPTGEKVTTYNFGFNVAPK